MQTSTHPALDIPSKTGDFAVREMVRCVYFVRRPHLAAADDISLCINRLVDIFPPPALSTFSTDNGDWLKFDADGLKAMVHKRLIKDQSPNTSVHIGGDQANIPDYNVEYAGLAMDRPILSEAALALWFQISANAIESKFEIVLQTHRDIINILNCSAAYIDRALEGDRTRLQAMSRRYRNADISHPRIVARDLGDKLPGVFWHTYIGSRLASDLGGQPQLTRVLGEDVTINTLNDGLELMFGPEPTLGDINFHPLDTSRVVLARLAHARGLLHVPRKVKYFEGENELAPLQAQEQWHLRFVNASD